MVQAERLVTGLLEQVHQGGPAGGQQQVVASGVGQVDARQQGQVRQVRGSTDGRGSEKAGNDLVTAGGQ